MASILIVPKKTIPGKKGLPVRTRYHVRWERGKGMPVVHLGVFDTETRAKRKVRESFDKLARGERPSKDPDAGAATNVTTRVVAARYLASRIDAAPSTLVRLGYDIGAINDQFGDRDPHTISPDDVQEWIVAQRKPTTDRPSGYAPGTIRNRLSTLRGVMTYARVRPNPARDDEIRLPRAESKGFRIPTRRELAKLYDELPEKYVGVVRLMEHGGLRISEAIAVRHEDWDRRKRRLLIRDSKTKAGVRFVDQIDGLPEMPPPGTGRVWPSVTRGGVQHAMWKACQDAGIGRFSPHDLRHLAVSRLLHDGVLSPAQIAARIGHGSPQITLAVYSHVVPPEDD